jgi:uncharacterized membrane protein
LFLSLTMSRKVPSRGPSRSTAGDALTKVIVPFFLLSIAATGLSYTRYAERSDIFWLFRVLLALFFAILGAAHFVRSLYRLYASMVFLPGKRFWVYGTGIAMIVGAVLLMVDATRGYGALCLFAVTLIVFPGNIACVVLKEPRRVVAQGSTTMAIARLPLQFTILRWIWWMAANTPESFRT